MADFNLDFVIFPNLTQRDFTGPLEVLTRLPQCGAERSLSPSVAIE